MKKIIIFFQKYYYVAGLGIALTIAFLLRTLYLTTVPNVIHLDEAALGYNAWCLSHFGVDRYLNEMPIYPQNYYGGQSPLYTYLVSAFIRIIGNGDISIFIVRLPGLIFSMLVVIFSIKTVHLIWHNKKLTLACAFLTAILPYYIMHGRVSLDCNLMFSCCVMAMYSITKYVTTQKISDLCLCGIAFGLVMYSYALSYILVPLCLGFCALYLLFVKKINIAQIILWAICVCVASLPILLFIASLLFKLEPFKFLCFNIYPFSSGRVTEISLEEFWSKLWYAIQTTCTHGGMILDSTPKFGTMYNISIPFIIIGFCVSVYHFYISIVKRCFHYSILFLLFYIACLITMGLVGAIEIYRANFLFTAYTYFLILGIHSVSNFLISYRRSFAIVLAGGYLVWALSFVRYYFSIYEIVIYPHSLYFIPATEAVSFAETELSVETIYIDSMGFQEVQLFFSPISPYEWTKTDFGEGYDHYNFVVNNETFISTENAYLTRKENAEFITMINQYAIPHETLEFENYYLFYFDTQNNSSF